MSTRDIFSVRISPFFTLQCDGKLCLFCWAWCLNGSLVLIGFGVQKEKGVESTAQTTIPSQVQIIYMCSSRALVHSCLAAREDVVLV